MEKLDKRRRAAGAPGVWCIRLPASPALVRRHRMQSVGGVWGDGRTVSAPVAFRRQARALAGAFLGQGEGGGTSVTAALFLAGAVLAAVVSLLEFVLGDHWLLYLLTTALLLLPPFFGTDTELAPVLLLALFQLAFWGLRMAETDRKRFSFGGGDRHGTASAHRLPPARGDPVSAGICRRHLRGQPLGGGGRPQPVP